MSQGAMGGVVKSTRSRSCPAPLLCNHGFFLLPAASKQWGRGCFEMMLSETSSETEQQAWLLPAAGFTSHVCVPFFANPTVLLNSGEVMVSCFVLLRVNVVRMFS